MVAPKCGGPGSGDPEAAAARSILMNNAKVSYAQAVFLLACGCRSCTVGALLKTTEAHMAILAGEALADERITTDFLGDVVCTMIEKVREFKEANPGVRLPDFVEYKPSGDKK